MNLELKSIKYTEWMSEETLCFTANLWVDGKVFAEVSNQGHGGCTDVRPHSKFKLDSTEGAMPFYRQLKKVEAHCNAMPNLEPCELFAEGLPMDLELWCNMEVEAFLARRDMKRKLKSHVLFQIKGQDGIYQTKYHPRKTDGSWTVFGSEKRRILNDMPLETALEIWNSRGFN